MRLFIIPAVYPNDSNPNAGSFVFEQTLELSKQGHDITVLDCSEYNYRHWLKPSCRRIVTTNDRPGIRYELHARGLMTSRFPRRAVARSLRAVRKLYAHAVRENGPPDVIVAHFTLPAGFAALKLAKEEKIPCIIVEHYSLLLADRLHPYIRSELTGAVKDAAAFLCVSESLKSAVERHTGLPGKIQVVPNLVDRRFVYSPAPEPPPFVFFSAGNLNKNKRFDLLIDSFCKAFSDKERVLLRIAGTGEERANLERMIRQNGRERQIRLLGLVSREEMAEEYRNCHCFVLLSRKETFGIAYREAMATGRPVISTRNGGIEEGWDDRNGMILEDISRLPAALQRMRSGYGGFRGREISRRCLARYSPDVVMKRLEEVLAETAGHDREKEA